MSSNTLQDLIKKLQCSYLDNDYHSVDKYYFMLIGIIRKNLFDSRKNNYLRKYYSLLASLLIWFDRRGVHRTPEIERMIGGIQALHGIISERIDTKSKKDLLKETFLSPRNVDILNILIDNSDGISIDELSNRTNLDIDTLSDMLSKLEYDGLIAQVIISDKYFVVPSKKGSYIYNRYRINDYLKEETKSLFICDDYYDMIDDDVLGLIVHNVMHGRQEELFVHIYRALGGCNRNYAVEYFPYYIELCMKGIIDFKDTYNIVNNKKSHDINFMMSLLRRLGAKERVYYCCMFKKMQYSICKDKSNRDEAVITNWLNNDRRLLQEEEIRELIEICDLESAFNDRNIDVMADEETA